MILVVRISFFEEGANAFAEILGHRAQDLVANRQGLPTYVFVRRVIIPEPRPPDASRRSCSTTANPTISPSA